MGKDYLSLKIRHVIRPSQQKIHQRLSKEKKNDHPNLYSRSKAQLFALLVVKAAGAWPWLWWPWQWWPWLWLWSRFERTRRWLFRPIEVVWVLIFSTENLDRVSVISQMENVPSPKDYSRNPSEVRRDC